MPRDVFGIPGETPEQEFEFLRDEGTPAPQQEAQETPAAPAASATLGSEPAPVEQGPAQVVAEPEIVPEEPAGEPVAPEKLWANKYQTPEALEQGYREATDSRRKALERARAVEEEYAAAVERNRLLEETLGRALPHLQKMARPEPTPTPGAYPSPYGDYGQAEAPQWSPDQLGPYVEQLVAQRVDQARQELEQQLSARNEVDDAEAAIEGFYENHPEVQLYSESDQGLAETLLALNESWEPYDTVLDVTDGDQLEVLYEASRRDALRQVLEMNPRYTQSEAGMKLARFEASLIEGDQPITQYQATVPASIVGQKRPVTERASTVSPSEASRVLDELDEAIAARDSAKRASFAGSVFE